MMLVRVGLLSALLLSGFATAVRAQDATALVLSKAQQNECFADGDDISRKVAPGATPVFSPSVTYGIVTRYKFVSDDDKKRLLKIRAFTTDYTNNGIFGKVDRKKYCLFYSDKSSLAFLTSVTVDRTGNIDRGTLLWFNVQLGDKLRQFPTPTDIQLPPPERPAPPKPQYQRP